MKSISKADDARRDELAARLEIEGANVAKSHAALLAATEAHNLAIAGYNEVLDEARSFAFDIANEIESYTTERSEKWQEGDAGQAYSAWLDEWQQWSPDDLTPVDEPELAEPDHIEELNNLPSGPEA